MGSPAIALISRTQEDKRGGPGTVLVRAGAFSSSALCCVILVPKNHISWNPIFDIPIDSCVCNLKH